MTNAEKYKEIFGLTVEPDMCPTNDCDICPCKKLSKSCFEDTVAWWNSEYKENRND